MELYIHVPFCRRKCRYCDFASWAGREKWIPAYVRAVGRQAAAARGELGPQPMETAYLGGGTPSILPPEALTALLQGVFACFPLAAGAEFTSECNPGTLTPAWLEAALAQGVNRLSMGMQAAQPHLLQALGRIHTQGEVEASVRLARRWGVKNLSLDLMFGLPGQTLEDWAETLEAALALSPQHLSCYALIPEEGTPLGEQVRAGEIRLPDEETERAMYDLAIRRLEKAGLAQYELSNFARPGFACRHNLGYWRQQPYLGLGPAAASMLPGEGDVFCRRLVNPRDLAAYLRQGETGRFVPEEAEEVTRAEARFETLMLGLRLNEGVSEADFAARHGVGLRAQYGVKLRSLARQGLLERRAGAWRLTRRGMDVQNAVLLALMDA